jgi:hypothetical protein
LLSLLPHHPANENTKWTVLIENNIGQKNSIKTSNTLTFTHISYPDIIVPPPPTSSPNFIVVDVALGPRSHFFRIDGRGSDFYNKPKVKSQNLGSYPKKEQALVRDGTKKATLCSRALYMPLQMSMSTNKVNLISGFTK